MSKRITVQYIAQVVTAAVAVAAAAVIHLTRTSTKAQRKRLYLKSLYSSSFRIKQQLKSGNLTIVTLVLILIRTTLTDIPLHHVTH